ncbi:MAG: DUF433 domain-containing protein [Myxococcota bacterium]
MLRKTDWGHIVIDNDGTPVIAGTSIKVVEVVLDHVAYGWSPEELHFQHPHLSMGQIHSALAYYWDHKANFERDIERRLERVEDLRRAAAGRSSLAEHLKARGAH